MNTTEYLSIIENIKSEIRAAQYRAAVHANAAIMQGFKSTYCILPQYDWKEIEGFDELELMQLKDIIKSTAHLIIRFARQGGLGNAANF
jgi:hypothetical protein